MGEDEVYDEIVGEALALCEELTRDDVPSQAAQLLEHVVFPESLTHWVLFVPDITLRAWKELSLSDRCIVFLSAREAMNNAQGVYDYFVERKGRVLLR